MTPAERKLLGAVLRWARADGVTVSWHRWTRRGPIEQRWGVVHDGHEQKLTIWRGRDTGKDYWVTSIAEALDVLAALGIVPARFSTAYRAGWDAYIEAEDSGVSGAPYRALAPAVQS